MSIGFPEEVKECRKDIEAMWDNIIIQMEGNEYFNPSKKGGITEQIAITASKNGNLSIIHKLLIDIFNYFYTQHIFDFKILLIPSSDFEI